VEYKEKKIKWTPEVAKEKIRAWCAYQERSQHETRQKLYEYGLDSDTVESILAELVSENFLNEERFSLAFASGKFRIKHWGRNKIKAALRLHKISDYCMKLALESIGGAEYEKVMENEIDKKIRTLNTKNNSIKYFGTLKYLVSRGFEAELVKEKLNERTKETKNEPGFEE